MYYGRNPSTGGLPVLHLLTRIAVLYLAGLALLGATLYRAGMKRERTMEAKRMRDAAHDELARRRRGAA